MKICNHSLKPFGKALLDYWQGNESVVLIHEFRNRQKKFLPVSVFFRSKEQLLPTEKAFDYCRGKILVVGGGTGVHAFELEQLGYNVIVIDICSEAVQIMKERKIKDVRLYDFFEFEGELFDTILMLGHNIGMCETLKGLELLLKKCEELLFPGGRLLVNSVQETETALSKNFDKYPGELEFCLTYKDIKGPWMRWLHMDFNTLSFIAEKCGWCAENLVNTDEGGFLAGLTLK